jgi:hypothetical protein
MIAIKPISPLPGVIPSGAALQAERGISRARDYLADFFASAAARSRSLAIVAAAGSLRFLLLFRRFAFVT